MGNFAPFIVPIMAAATAPLGAPTTSTYQGNWLNGSNVATFSFTSVPFGTANANRRIVLMLASNGGSGGPAGPTSVTIGGVAATRDYAYSPPSATSAIYLTLTAYSAPVPTGTSGTVALVYASASYNYPFFAAYSLINSDGVPAFFNGASTSVAGTAASTTLATTWSMPAGGVAFAIARDATSITSGLTQDATQSQYYNWVYGSGAPGGGPLTVTVNRNNAGGTSGGNLAIVAYG